MCLLIHVWNVCAFVCVCYCRKKELKTDLYCLPAALAELGLVHLDSGADLEEAERAFEEARYREKPRLSHITASCPNAMQFRVEILKPEI